MKNEVVKVRTAGHARILAKRLLSSKSRNSSRLANILSSRDVKPIAAGYSIGTEADISDPHNQLLAVKASQTSSASKVAHVTHSHSTASVASTALTKSVVPPSTSATLVTNSTTSRSHVSGAAMGIAFGLIGLAILAIGVVWTLRRRHAKGKAAVPRWKRDPFSDAMDTNSSSARPETIVGLSKHSNRKSEGYLRLGDEKALPPPMSVMSSVHADAHSSFLAQSMVITPPSNTFNNPISPSSAASLSPVITDKHRNLARVLRAFLPTLPDELQIHQGELIEVLNSFDDGWALCLNQHGEKGVVPLECLSRNANKGELSPQDGDGNQWRLSKRASSLYAGTSPDSY